MATRYYSTLIAAFLMLAGCQGQSTSTVVDSMPAPSFSGPSMQEDLPPPGYASGPIYAPPGHPHSAGQAPPSTIHPKITAGIPADWIPHAKLNTWKWIVIHHSATPTGGAFAFDKMHKAKGWDELGYHFVVGNGTDTRDGQIEVGSRWPKQKWGAHTKTPDNQFNEHGIGICMVGNFDVSHPTEVQTRAVAKLVAYLMKTYHIPPDHVVGHRDCKSTDCPGRFVSVARIRQQSIQILAAAGDPIP
ncbi:MAG TPA: peptidoglycan recognition family protein, partial [Humisphaera sp.]|nr:peptidoglycan recognition family protein [Humisphaera sp.]